jgi:hypothetical protein
MPTIEVYRATSTGLLARHIGIITRAARWGGLMAGSVIPWCLGFFAAVMVFAGRATADDLVGIGRSVFVVSDVEGQLGDTPAKRIAINDDILFNEDITTGAEAKTVIEFRDGSTFEVGPGSVVRIDSFVFNPDEGVSRKALQVGTGVFRYVSAFVTADQGAQISTPGGTLAIRGSVISGIVDPETPTFVYVGEGNASFANDGGSTDLPPGSAIAVPTRTTPPMRPEAMPPAVAAQALQAIERRLPPREVLRVRPQAGEAWLRQAGAANLLPVSEQTRREGAVTRGRALPATAGASPIARELGLLTEGQRRNLFDGSRTGRTPEQEAFVAETRRAMPNAGALLAHSAEEARALHGAASLAGTAVVIRGVAKAAPSPEVVTRVAATAIHANPAAATQITRYATEGYRGPDRARAVAGIQKAAAAGAGRSPSRLAPPGTTPSRATPASLPRQFANPAQPPQHPGGPSSAPRPEQRLPVAARPGEQRATAVPPAARQPPVARQRQAARPMPQPVLPKQPPPRQPAKPEPKKKDGSGQQR